MPEPSATVDYRVRFDESGPSGLARPSLFLRLAQDIAWIHSEQLGFTRAWYAERGLAWLVRAVSLSVHGDVRNGDTVRATTRVVGYRRILARRMAEMVVADRLAVVVLTDWVLTDSAGRPVRIPDDFASRAPGTTGGFEPLRVRDQSSGAPNLATRGLIRSTELDPLQHVNNAAYLDRIADLLASADGDAAPATGSLPDRPAIEIEYVAAATAGDVVEESAWFGEGSVTYRMEAIGRGPLVRAVVSSVSG